MSLIAPYGLVGRKRRKLGLAATPGLVAYWSMAGNVGTDGQRHLTLVDVKGGFSPSGSVVNTNPLYETDAFGPGLPGLYSAHAGPGRGWSLAGGPLVGLEAATVGIVLRPTGAVAAEKGVFGRRYGFQVGLNSANQPRFLLSNNGTSVTRTINAASSITYEANHVLIARFGSGTAYLELDGVQLGTGAFTGPIVANADPFCISLVTGTAAFDGFLGEMALSNQLLGGADLSAFRSRLAATVGMTL